MWDKIIKPLNVDWKPTCKSYTELEIQGFLHRKVTKHLLGHISAINNDALWESAETETA